MLIASFLAIIWAGHVPLMFMILGIQVRGGGGHGGMCLSACLHVGGRSTAEAGWVSLLALQYGCTPPPPLPLPRDRPPTALGTAGQTDPSHPHPTPADHDGARAVCAGGARAAPAQAAG